jgi:RimJ/RimL family protein N-acetyltransferase
VTPPYRIETERLVIRCYDPEDAPLLKEAVDASIDHLLPWMPWARNEPQTLDENYPYGIFTPDETRQLGGAGLHPRGGEGSLEIGYFIRADAIGQGLATEVTAALTRAGIEKSGLDRVDVQVDPENERSVRIPRKLGFTEEALLRRRLESKEPGGPRRDSLLFTMLAEELPASPCMAYEYTAYDVLGREL